MGRIYTVNSYALGAVGEQRDPRVQSIKILGTAVTTMAEGASRRRNPRTSATSKEAVSELLAECDNKQLFQLTKFYRERIVQAIEEAVVRLSSAMRQEQYFRRQDHEEVTVAAERGSRRDSAIIFLNIVNETGSRARRAMWQSMVKWRNELPKVDKILNEIWELGPDPYEYMITTASLTELSSQLKDVQQKHKETLRAQTETLRVNTILVREKVKCFPLVDGYAELSLISTVRDRRLLEHELLMRGRAHEQWREIQLRGEWEKIGHGQLFHSCFAQSKSRSGSSAAVVGVTGIGKTTMAQKLVYDWATDNIYHQFQFVFSFKFGDLNNINCRINLSELLLGQYPYLENVLPEIWKNPERVLFIFDALDEFKDRIDFADTEASHMCPDPDLSCEVSDIVCSLIQHQLLPGCSVLVTTRPIGLQTLEKAEISVRAEILGFVGEERKGYFNRFFEDQEVAAAVFKHVEENEILSTMSYNPSYCWILGLALGPFFAQRHRDRQRLPKTATQIYSYHIYNILKNHHRAIDNPLSEVLLGLGQLAFMGVSEKKFVFTGEDLAKYKLQPSRFLSGLLAEVLEGEGSARSVVYTFPHLSVQEFFAALAQFMTTHPGDIIKLTAEAQMMPDRRFVVLLRFLAGLSFPLPRVLEEYITSFPRQTICRVIDWLKANVGHQTANMGHQTGKRRLLDALHFLFESHNSELAQTTMASVDKLSFHGLRLDTNDCTVLFWAIGLCDTIKCLDLYDCRIGCEGLQRLEPALHKCLDLTLCSNQLGDSGMKLLSRVLQKPQCLIEKLRLDTNGMTAACANDLSVALSTNRSLKELSLSGNRLENSGVRLMSAALSHPECKMEKLDLLDARLTDSCFEDLASALSAVNSLTGLDLALNSFTDQSVPALQRLIPNLPCLQWIQLERNPFSIDGKEQLKSLQETRSNLNVIL